MKHCWECGCRLEERELEQEGRVPFCPRCGEFRFPIYSVAVSMVILNRENGKTLLIKQYGKDFYRLVAGYVNRGETLEHAAAREIREETGMRVSGLHFNRTSFFEPSNTLMCNFTATVEDDREFHPNGEIDSFGWFAPEEAAEKLDPERLAGRFFNAWLADAGRGR